ncbi:MAG: hypothetical protein WC205_10955 [Opitutaceae bacterium]|jgi:hypothetical protein
MIIALSSGVNAFVNAVEWFDPYCNLQVVKAELFWWFGGVFFAFGMGAFSTILRATRGAMEDVAL